MDYFSFPPILVFIPFIGKFAFNKIKRHHPDKTLLLPFEYHHRNNIPFSSFLHLPVE
jgi:hypothetical protein